MITLNQLANALSLQEHGNFRRAAEAQHLSQPAFSRSIQKLEASLGVMLFDRQASGVRPTIYGDALLKRASTMLIEVSEIERETQLLSNFDIGTISLAMGFYAAEMSGCKAVAEMIRLHPDLRCQVTVKDWHDVEEMVLNREVDIGFAATKPIKGNKQLQIEPIAEHDFIYFCRRDHSLLKQANLTKADLDNYPVVTVRVPPQMASMFAGKSYHDQDSGLLSPSVRAGDQTTARAIVSGSDAFSIAAPVQIEPWLRSGEFKVLSFRESWMKMDYGFIYRKDRMLVPAAEAFMQHVCKIEAAVAQRNIELIEEYFPDTGDSSKR